ncbi:MAG: SCO family protein [Rhodospirillales bacterium]|nr:SCO family protein [Rhodospirillales bacterium]
MMPMRLAGLVLAFGLFAGTAQAVTNATRPVESVIDPTIFRIDEKAFLGVKLDGATRFQDTEGREFRLADKLGKPLILVLAYYQCDGTCSVVNDDLKSRLVKASRIKAGRDFEVLTASFDKNDTPATLAAFAKELALPTEMAKGWTLATFADPQAIKPFADTLGFKFFWSARDRIFFHPGVYAVLTAEGRVARFLYALTADAKDIELAVTEAEGNKISVARAFDYAIGLCYSYNFQDGRYTINLPVIIAGASLLLGIMSFAVSAFIYRRRHLREGTT